MKKAADSPHVSKDLALDCDICHSPTSEPKMHLHNLTAPANPLPIDTKWFFDRIEDKKLTHRQVAAKLEMDPASLSHMLRGNRKVQLTDAQCLAETLGVPLPEVLAAAGIDVMAGAGKSVLITGWIGDDSVVTLEKPTGPRRVPSPEGLPEGSAALRYQTAGSALELMDGWIVYYTPRQDVDAYVVGRLCVVQVAPKGPRYVRFVRRGYTRGTYNLISQLAEEKMIDSVQLAWASPVTWIKTGA